MAEWRGIDLHGLVLHSGRLTLRPWQAGDAGWVHEAMAAPELHRYLRLPQPYTLESARSFVGEYARTGVAEGSYLPFAIAENSTGRLVGAIGLHHLTSPDGAEIGYWLARSDWGNGYAAESATTLARFALSAGSPRVTIRCDVSNSASAAVALRAGFRFEGILRAGVLSSAGVADSAVFGRTATDPDGPIAAWLPPMGVLDDGTVGLRPATPEDGPVIHAELTDPLSDRFALSDHSTLTLAESGAIAAAEPLRWLVGPAAQLIVLDSISGTPAGLMTLRRSGPPAVAGIGYGLLPAFRGNGYTARALRLLSGWVFDHTTLHRLEIGCKPANIASARAAERAGFTAEARLRGRLADHATATFSDELKYSLLRSDR
jgi:RimJ/RimL family protein N-acetyltransferase